MKRKLNLQFFAENENPIPTVQASEASMNGEEPLGESEEETVEPVTEESMENSSEDSVQNSVLSDEVIRKIYGHLARLEEETKELKEIFPDFDLYRELRNPVFARLTAPESGISAVDAYYAVHRKEIQAMKPVIKEAPPQRPSENGISAQAPAVMEFDYRNATKERREALKKAIRSAAARGEKIYPH